MADLQEYGALKERFAVAKPDYAVHGEQQAELAAEERTHNEMGLKSGSVESIHKTSAAATIDAQSSLHDKAEQEARQRADDLLFLDILRKIEDVDREIEFLDKQVELLSQTIADLQSGNIDLGEALRQDHVQRAIREWEARNPGQTFDPSADDASQRLQAILDEQRRLDGNAIAGLRKDRKTLVQQAEENNDLYKTDPELAKQQAEERVAEGYGAAETSHTVTEHVEIKELSAVGQDTHRNKEIDTEKNVAENDDAFGALGLASADLNDQFETASVKPSSQETEIASAPTPATDPSMSG